MKDTPWDAFERERAALGFDVKYDYESRNAACDSKKKVVHFGPDLNRDELGVVGLHELGHAATEHLFAGPALELLQLKKRVLREGTGVNFTDDDMALEYALEQAAWAWAVARIPAGYEGVVERCRTFGLSSYEHTRAVLAATCGKCGDTLCPEHKVCHACFPSTFPVGSSTLEQRIHELTKRRDRLTVTEREELRKLMLEGLAQALKGLQ